MKVYVNFYFFVVNNNVGSRMQLKIGVSRQSTKINEALLMQYCDGGKFDRRKLWSAARTVLEGLFNVLAARSFLKYEEKANVVF